MKIFLSGSISNDPNYKEHFKEAKERFSHEEVFDPSQLPPGLSHEAYMKICLANLPLCDKIYYVNDVATSKGSFIERIVAMACGIEEIT